MGGVLDFYGDKFATIYRIHTQREGDTHTHTKNTVCAPYAYALIEAAKSQKDNMRVYWHWRTTHIFVCNQLFFYPPPFSHPAFV
jgi:hypothetical protein